MTLFATLARLEAARGGRAQPLRAVRHTHLAERPMVIVPLVLAGDLAVPLAAMAGTERRRPALLVVARPNRRDDRMGFAARLARVVLPYVEDRQRDAERVPERPEAIALSRRVRRPLSRAAVSLPPRAKR